MFAVRMIDKGNVDINRGGQVDQVRKCFYFENLDLMLRISVLLFIGIILISCNGDQAGGSAGGSSGGGTFTAPIPPSPNFRETGLLARDYWVFEFYVVPNDREASTAGKGRWYKFKPDGSFESGHWDKVMGSGSWGIGLRNEGTVLHIDSNVDAEDSEFIIQANASGDEMSWVGTTTYEQSGLMLKAIHLLTQPTKEQFGLE